MRTLLVIFLHVALFGNSYEFDEYKFIKAVSSEFKKSGTITLNKNETIIIYTHPTHKQIIKNDTNVTIIDSSNLPYILKGQASYYAKLFIDIMARLGEFSEIKSNKDFDVVQNGSRYLLTFKGDLSNQIRNAEVETKDSYVRSFKMFMPNEDTLQIVKK